MLSSILVEKIFPLGELEPELGGKAAEVDRMFTKLMDMIYKARGHKEEKPNLSEAKAIGIAFRTLAKSVEELREKWEKTGPALLAERHDDVIDCLTRAANREFSDPFGRVERNINLDDLRHLGLIQAQDKIAAASEFQAREDKAIEELKRLSVEVSLEKLEAMSANLTATAAISKYLGDVFDRDVLPVAQAIRKIGPERPADTPN